jgi:hypothetical protein
VFGGVLGNVEAEGGSVEEAAIPDKREGLTGKKEHQPPHVKPGSSFESVTFRTVFMDALKYDLYRTEGPRLSSTHGTTRRCCSNCPQTAADLDFAAAVEAFCTERRSVDEKAIDVPMAGGLCVCNFRDR